MAKVSQLTSPDVFFFHQTVDVLLQAESELLWGLRQTNRSMFFNREEGGGLANKENYPNSLLLQIQTRFGIVAQVARKNSLVTDGSDGPDRRIAISWNSINIKVAETKGELNVEIFYIPFKDFKITSTTLPLG